MPPISRRADLYGGPMDMRSSIDALARFVEAMLERSALCGEA